MFPYDSLEYHRDQAKAYPMYSGTMTPGPNSIRTECGDIILLRSTLLNSLSSSSSWLTIDLTPTLESSTPAPDSLTPRPLGVPDMTTRTITLAEISRIVVAIDPRAMAECKKLDSKTTIPTPHISTISRTDVDDSKLTMDQWLVDWDNVARTLTGKGLIVLYDGPPMSAESVPPIPNINPTLVAESSPKKS